MTRHGRALAVLAGRLSGRDRWLLRMLYEHTALTTTHLHRLRWAESLRQVQGRAQTLRRLQVIDGFRPMRAYGYGSHPLHLILGPVGAQVLAAETGLTIADLGYRGPVRALSVAHRLSLRHDIELTGLVCDLAVTPGVEVVRWWSTRRCRLYFGDHTRPDAYLTLTTHPHHVSAVPGGAGSVESGRPVRWWEMFLEYDTGTENLHQLTSKVAGYHSLAEYTGVVTPVGIWFTRPARETSARRALAAAVEALPVPSRVPILTATATATATRTDPSIGGRRVGVLTGNGSAVPRRGEPSPGASTGAGGRVWLPLYPAHGGRVTLAALATPRHPEPFLGPGPDTAPGTDAAGPLPAPHPYPPTDREPRHGGGS